MSWSSYRCRASADAFDRLTSTEARVSSQEQVKWDDGCREGRDLIEQLGLEELAAGY